MKKIETNSGYDYKKLFDASVDKKNGRRETAGKDEYGNLILEKAEGETREYFVLTPEEYRLLVENAREDGAICRWKVKNLLKEAEKEAAPRGKIVSFETVTLHLSWMRGVAEYEIVDTGEGAEVSEYAIRYRDGKSERELEQRAVCEKEKMLAILNSCSLLSWDGFHGKHPRGVLDGTMFRLEATVNGGREICADGSQNFPKHYHEFRDALYAILNPPKTNDGGK